MAGDLAHRSITYALELGAGKEVSVNRVQWPSPKYASDPLGFAHDILGVGLWSKQVEILEAARDHNRVAVSGGRKIGKDFVVAVLALWWFCSHPNARIVMTATTADQIDDILWSEIKRLHERSGKCLACRKSDPHDVTIARPCPHSQIIDGEPQKLARTGLDAPGHRRISGHTAREGEAVAGRSGKYLMYILDEASGIPDEIHRAIRGNFAGGGKELIISNPTQTEGFFFDAFHKHQETQPPLYKAFEVSSLDSPNVVQGREVIEGLATREWVEEEKREYGEDSPFYKIHVLGKFVPAEDGKIINASQIEQAIKRWKSTPAEGRLFIGIDPAGGGVFGDDSAFAGRRGMKIVDLSATRFLNPQRFADDHVVWLLGFIAKNKKSGDLKPIVLIDKSGKIGAEVWGALVAHGDADYELVGVQPSDAPKRQAKIYDRHRDELHANMADWLRDGGALPDDAKLRKDLHAASWVMAGEHRKMKATPKKEIIKKLGRSPDRGDAVQLACWEPAFYRMAEGDESQAESADDVDERGALSPYEGSIGPYGDGPSPYGGSAGHDPDE